MAKDVDIKIDYKAERLLDDLMQINSYVKVGILADPDAISGTINSKTTKKARNKEGKSKDQIGVSILQVAAIHEFGSKKINIPERSFLRSTADEEKEKLGKTVLRLAKAEVKKTKPAPFQILGKIGAYLQRQVRRKFTNNDWPALKDPTRGGKNKDGLAMPLIDTGQLRRSISYELVKKGRYIESDL